MKLRIMILFFYNYIFFHEKTLYFHEIELGKDGFTNL